MGPLDDDSTRQRPVAIEIDSGGFRLTEIGNVEAKITQFDCESIWCRHSRLNSF